MQPKILIFDIENTPNLGWYYDRYQQGNIVANENSWWMLSFAYKWFGEKDIHVLTLRDYPGYDRDRRNDRSLVSDLWRTLSAADVIIAHNGVKHDLRKANARFVYHRLPPPTASRVIDTFKSAKKHFGFESNKLEALGKFFGLGGKVPTIGFELHQRVMGGEDEAWDKLIEYNARDVELLEQVYLRLRPFITPHPGLTDFTRGEGCPTCLSPKVKKNGLLVARTGYYAQKWRCLACGSSWTTRGPRINSVDNAPQEDIDVLHWEWQGGSDGSNGSDGSDRDRVDRSVVD